MFAAILYTYLFVWEMSVRCLDLWCEFWWVRWKGDFWMIGLWEMLDFCGLNGVGMVFCFEYFVWIFWRFWSSSIKALFYKGWEVFWRHFWWFLVMLKWRKTLIFQGVVELGIELKMGLSHGWNRCAVPDFRWSAPKCKPRPLLA